MVRLSLIAAALVSLPVIVAHPSTSLNRRNVREGCGTEEPSPKFLAAVSELAAGDAQYVSPSAAGFRASSVAQDPFADIKIDTYIHVVAASQTTLGGWIPDERLKAQMDVLNADYAPSKIQFVLKGVTRQINANWTVDRDGSELQMKKALRKGDYKTLNLYFLTRLRFNALGYAYFPEPNVAPGSDKFYAYGATNHHLTVPGGEFTRFNLGKTVVHEVGHWLGLMHTFEGFNCTGPGDLIADTAIHNEPSSGCPIGLDSCPDGEGPDPIHNYMDYSDDACYQEFTPLQTKRIHDVYNAFLSPRACNADNCLRSLRSSTIPGRLEESRRFCSDFTKITVTDVTAVKPFAASACNDNIARISSACTCLPAPTP